MATESLVSLTWSLLRNDIMRISVLGFRSDLRIELQAPVRKQTALTSLKTRKIDKGKVEASF